MTKRFRIKRIVTLILLHTTAGLMPRQSVAELPLPIAHSAAQIRFVYLHQNRGHLGSTFVAVDANVTAAAFTRSAKRCSSATAPFHATRVRAKTTNDSVFSQKSLIVRSLSPKRNSSCRILFGLDRVFLPRIVMYHTVNMYKTVPSLQQSIFARGQPLRTASLPIASPCGSRPL